MTPLDHGALWWTGVSVLGLSVGVVAGMFGVGGGFLLTPLLSLVFGVPLDVAVGSGLCQMIGVAVAAQIRYARLQVGESKLGGMMVAGAVIGVVVGARAVDALKRAGTVTLLGVRPIAASDLYLKLGYLAMLLSVAAWMARDAARQARSGEDLDAVPPPGVLITRVALPPLTLLPRTGRRVSIPLFAYVGLFIGFLSGLLGVGGGVVLTPLLLYGVGMPVPSAAGTGVGLLLATSVVGTIEHARLGHVHLPLAITLLVGSTLGAQIGAMLTTRLNGRRLRGLFVYLVLACALAVVFDLTRKLLGGG